MDCDKCDEEITEDETGLEISWSGDDWLEVIITHNCGQKYVHWLQIENFEPVDEDD